MSELPSATEAIEQLLAVMAALRDPEGGCPWDLKQSYQSIVPYTLEEAYEVADTIERGDFNHLKEELGDLLFQVVFYARLAQEEGRFDFADVSAAMATKLIKRHPHVFGSDNNTNEEQVKRNWEAGKAQERKAKGQGQALADIPLALPALSRAQKLSKRAASVGFDWPEAEQVWRKLEEESDELRQAIANQDKPNIEEELGDMLFVMVNLGRHLGVDAETALRKSSIKFEQRFNHVEAQVQHSSRDWDEYKLTELDNFWREAKELEKPH